MSHDLSLSKVAESPVSLTEQEGRDCGNFDVPPHMHKDIL